MTAIAQAQDDDAELVEQVARAICSASGIGKPDDMMGVLFGCGGQPNTPTPPYRWQQHIKQAEAAIEALARLSATTPDTTVLVERLREARPYVERVALGDGTMPEIVCAEASLNAIDEALASTANPTGETR